MVPIGRVADVASVSSPITHPPALVIPTKGSKVVQLANLPNGLTAVAMDGGRIGLFDATTVTNAAGTTINANLLQINGTLDVNYSISAIPGELESSAAVLYLGVSARRRRKGVFFGPGRRPFFLDFSLSGNLVNPPPSKSRIS